MSDPTEIGVVMQCIAGHGDIRFTTSDYDATFQQQVKRKMQLNVCLLFIADVNQSLTESSGTCKRFNSLFKFHDLVRSSRCPPYSVIKKGIPTAVVSNSNMIM